MELRLNVKDYMLSILETPPIPGPILRTFQDPLFVGLLYILSFVFIGNAEGRGVSGWASFFQPPHFVQLVQVGRVLTLIIHQFNSKDYKG